MPIERSASGSVTDADLIRATLAYGKRPGAENPSWTYTQVYLVGSEEKVVSVPLDDAELAALNTAWATLSAKAKAVITTAEGL